MSGVPALAWRPDGQKGVIARLRTWLTSGAAWREQAFLLLRFPLGLAFGILAVAIFAGIGNSSLRVSPALCC